MTHTHTGHAVRHVRCGRPLHYRAFRAGPTHALVATADRMAFAALCGATVRLGSGEVPNVMPACERGSEAVACERCRQALGLDDSVNAVAASAVPAMAGPAEAEAESSPARARKRGA